MKRESNFSLFKNQFQNMLHALHCRTKYGNEALCGKKSQQINTQFCWSTH